MKKVNAANLSGKSLTWCVIQALGFKPELDKLRVCYRSDHGSWVYPDYERSEDAAPIINDAWIGLERPSLGQTTPVWRAITNSVVKPKPGHALEPVVSAWGATCFIAAMRVFVISRLGNLVDVPEIILSEEEAVS